MITPLSSPAFGNNAFRMEWINRLQTAGANLATLIHPTAYVSPTAAISPGTVILPHAIVNTYACSEERLHY